MRKYPEIKEHKREYNREYKKRPEYREYDRNYKRQYYLKKKGKI